jgi:outer membrane protein
MNKNIKNWLFGIALIAIIAFLIYDKCVVKKIVFVDTIALVEQYNMKQEMTGKLQRAFDLKKGNYDSLMTILLLDSNNVVIKRALFDIQQELEEINTRSSEINTHVWQSINPLLAKFGEQHNYNIIIGANGMGTVLYGQTHIDITQEVLAYINNEYEGNTNDK